MGKQTQNEETSEMTNNRTYPSFKWGRMFQVLDYHHWYYVKKVLANKKRHQRSTAKAVESHMEDLANGDSNKCSMESPTKHQRPQVQEYISNSYDSGENCTPPLSPTAKRSPVLSSSPSTKSSRATRIKKMIAREVIKRRGRHRRSSTCPISSDLVSSNHIHSHDLEGVNDDGVIEAGNNNMNKCDKKQVDELGELSPNHMKMIHENVDESINQVHLHKKIRRSLSLDVVDVRSMDRRCFPKILDDPRPSRLKKTLSTKKVESSVKRKPLTKCGTFPVNKDPSSARDSDAFDVTKLQQKSSEKTKTLIDGFAPRLRFRDLRRKIKHVIKESKKDRHIIAMDAVLHKVPFGQKVPEESTKDVPCVNTCESNNEHTFSPGNKKDVKPCKKRSPSLDEYSLDKYCVLFETTSSSKEATNDTNTKSRLRVMDDDDSDKSEQKRLERVFSFPNLQQFLNNQYENSTRDVPLSTFNRRIMSFNERNVQEILDRAFEFSNKDKNKVDAYSNCVELTSKNNQSDTTQHVLIPNKELTTSTISQDSVHMFQETQLIGLESTHHERTTQSEEEFNESPTYKCIKEDEDEVQKSVEHISPSLQSIQVEGDEIEEFNYVKDILQISGYLGTELLGTWYSSDQPVDPSIFIEFESCSQLETKYSSDFKEGTYSNHLLLFDLINEILLAIYERSVSYWCAPLSSCSRTHPMPKGDRILDVVWVYIKWYMSCSMPGQLDPSLDCITSRDLAKDEKWMNLQFDAECVGLEVEEMIFDDLLDEFAY